jgi:hypothetical protein
MRPSAPQIRERQIGLAPISCELRVYRFPSERYHLFSFPCTRPCAVASCLLAAVHHPSGPSTWPPDAPATAACSLLTNGNQASTHPPAYVTPDTPHLSHRALPSPIARNHAAGLAPLDTLHPSRGTYLASDTMSDLPIHLSPPSRSTHACICTLQPPAAAITSPCSLPPFVPPCLPTRLPLIHAATAACRATHPVHGHCLSNCLSTFVSGHTSTQPHVSPSLLSLTTIIAVLPLTNILAVSAPRPVLHTIYRPP